MAGFGSKGLNMATRKNGTLVDPHADAIPVTKASFVLAACEGGAYYCGNVLGEWAELHNNSPAKGEIGEDPS